MPLHLLLGPAGARKTGRLLDAHQAAARAGREAWLAVPGGTDLAAISRELLGGDLPGGIRRTATPYADVFGAPELTRRLLRLAGGPSLLTQDQRRVVAEATIATAMRERRLEALLPAARRGWLADELIRLADELTITEDLPAATAPEDAEGAQALRALERWGGSANGRRGWELAQLLRDDLARRRVLAGGDGPVDQATGVLLLDRALRGGLAEVDGLHLTLAAFTDLDPVQRRLVVGLGRTTATVLLSLPYEEGREALAAAGPLVSALLAAGAEPEVVRFEPEAVAVAPALAAIQEGLYEAAPPAGDAPAGTSAAIPEGAAPSVVELRGAGPDEELALIAELVAEEVRAGTPSHRVAIVSPDLEQHAPAIVAALARRGVPAHVGGRARAASTPIVRGLLSLLRAAAAHGARDGDGGEASDLVRWIEVIDPAGAGRLDALVRRRDARTVRDALRLWQRDISGGPRIEGLDRLLGAGERPGSRERAIAELLAEAALDWASRGPGGRLDPGSERAIRAAREVSGAMERRAAFVERAWNLTPRLALPAGLDDLARDLEARRLEPEPEPPGSIAVVDPLAVRTRTYEVLVIAGAQRGSFPAAEPTRRALGPADRGALTADHGWPAPVAPSHAAAERYLAYEVATTPIRRLAIGWHDGDGDGGSAEPSPLVAELRRVAGPAMACRRMEAGRAAIDGLDHEQAAALAAAAAGPRHREVQHDRSPALAAEARDHHAVRALQTASRCTAQWFVEQHLRPQPLDPDAAPLTAGRMRHDLLADLLRGVLEEGVELGPDALPVLETGLAGAAARLAESGERRAETLAERLLRERVVAELEATLPALCGTRPLAHQPSELELSFGVPGRGEDGEEPSAEPRPPVVVRRGGHELALSGRIDRLDVDPEHDEVVVVDYKGANVEPYRGGGWVEHRELQAGLYALVAEQLTEARAVGSLYQAVPGPPEVPPRGATVERLGDRGMRHNSRDVVGAEAWESLLDDLVRLAAEAATAIEQGTVSPCPASCSDDGCRHPWLCREQRG